jgi:transcription elongation factor GreB
MNKAFTRDDGQDEAPFVPPRAPLPEGVPNYVTARGLALLREEMAGLEAERAGVAGTDESDRRRALASIGARAAELSARIASSVLVDPASSASSASSAPGRVRFGVTVRVRAPDGERTYRIVGVDEADPARGLVAFTSPIARALTGREEGDVAVVRTPVGDTGLEILEILPDAPE